MSGYGTGGDSGSDKTPPYLPTHKAPHHFNTLGHHHSAHHGNQNGYPKGICNPMEGHVTYSQLTLPSSRNGNVRYTAGPDKAIYSQVDMSRKTSSVGGSNKGGHLHYHSNPYNSEDPHSWAPLLGNRNQPESSL